eukprot:Opistho-2@49676
MGVVVEGRTSAAVAVVRPSPNEIERAVAEERRRQRVQRLIEVRERSKAFETMMTRQYRQTSKAVDTTAVCAARKQWQTAHEERIRRLVERLDTAQSIVGEANEMAAKVVAENQSEEETLEAHMRLLHKAQERYKAAVDDLAEKEMNARSLEEHKAELRESTARRERERARLVAARQRVRESVLAEAERQSRAADKTRDRDIPPPAHYNAFDERGLWQRRRNNQDVPMGLVHIEGSSDTRAKKAMADAEREIARVRALQAANEAERIAEDIRRQDRGHAAFARERMEAEARAVVSEMEKLARIERRLRQDEALATEGGSAALAGTAARRRFEAQIEREFERQFVYLREPQQPSVSVGASTRQPSSRRDPPAVFATADADENSRRAEADDPVPESGVGRWASESGDTATGYRQGSHLGGDGRQGADGGNLGSPSKPRTVSVHWRPDSRLAIVHSPTHNTSGGERDDDLILSGLPRGFDPTTRRDELQPMSPAERLDRKLAEILGFENVPWHSHQ